MTNWARRRAHRGEGDKSAPAQPARGDLPSLEDAAAAERDALARLTILDQRLAVVEKRIQEDV